MDVTSLNGYEALDFHVTHNRSGEIMNREELVERLDRLQKLFDDLEQRIVLMEKREAIAERRKRKPYKVRRFGKI